MKIVNKKVTEIKPYEKNPRKNDEAVKYVAESIRQFGFKVPIILDNNNIIIAGHTRYKAAKEIGLNEVPCVIADDLTDEQTRAFRLADNKVSEKAEWDNELLIKELEEITNISMEDFNFNINDYINDDVFEDINDNGYAETTRFEHKLKIDRQEIIMTDEEYKKIIDIFNKYVNENGVSFGFVEYLVGGRDD